MIDDREAIDSLSWVFHAVDDGMAIGVMVHWEAVTSQVTSRSLVAKLIIVNFIDHLTISPHRLVWNPISLYIRLKIDQVRILIVARIVPGKLWIIEADKNGISRLDVAVDIVMTFVAAGIGPADQMKGVKVSAWIILAVYIVGSPPIKIGQTGLRRNRRWRLPIGGDERRFRMAVKT